MKKKKDFAELSLPKSMNVRGYEIKRMPIGKYLIAIEKLRNLPEDFISNCFPNESVQSILDIFSNIKEENVIQVLAQVFMTAPAYIVSFVSELTEIPEESLLNDENIGLDGFIEIVKAFIEVNSLGKLMQGAGEIKSMIKVI